MPALRLGSITEVQTNSFKGHEKATYEVIPNRSPGNLGKSAA